MEIPHGLKVIGKRLGLLPSPAVVTGEVLTAPEIEALKWEEASLGPGFMRRERYAALLTRRDNPASKVYASLEVHPSRLTLDIPLSEDTPEEILRHQAYLTTFFGDIDPVMFRSFATADFTAGKLMAFLNKKTAGTYPKTSTDWFHKSFGVNLHDRSGDYFIGSHGVRTEHGFNHNETIERSSSFRSNEEPDIQSVIAFARGAENAFRHLSITPLPVETYLQDIQSTLKFLPKDWKQLA